MESLQDIAARVAKEEAKRMADAVLPDRPSSPVWAALRSAGTRLWLDTGDMDAAAKLWTREFEALTTNNTLLNAEVQRGQYDRTIRRAAEAFGLAARQCPDHEVKQEISFVLNATHGLRLAHRFSAAVSVELHTDLADDVDRSVAFGRRLHAICPERFIVKVPLTAAGYVAARRLSAEGIPVNFTLGFSARQNVLAAVLARPLYVNVFMGRLNAFVADNRLGDGRNVGEKATLSTQRHLRVLRESSGIPTRLIGASMRDGGQVVALAGVDVVTLPPRVVADFATNPPAGPIARRLDDDPMVELGAGVTPEAVGALVLWDVPAEFLVAAHRIAASPVTAGGPEELCAALRREGFGDLLPDWTEDDRRSIAADGKIPKFERWQARLTEGRLGLDALMNAAGLASFAADQAALDARVMSLL